MQLTSLERVKPAKPERQQNPRMRSGGTRYRLNKNTELMKDRGALQMRRRSWPNEVTWSCKSKTMPVTAWLQD
jgi:hypothetical protein